MARFFIIFVLLFLHPSSLIIAQEHPSPIPSSPAKHNSVLSYLDAIILGTVQGITEFLPISSTGHLILANRVLKLDSDDAVFNANGTPILKKKRGQESPYTINDATDSYSIIIQGGTILAILFLYWKSVISILSGLIGHNPGGRKLARNILLAFLPAACTGLIFGSWIETHLFSPKTVIIALIAGALLMFGIERLRSLKKRNNPLQNDQMALQDLTVRQCLTIGGLQCLAMWPGTSRSMITIVGGYIAGLSPSKAAEFSFLLGLVTLSTASSYKLLVDGHNMAKVLNLWPAIFGCMVAFITGAIAVKWLVNYLNCHGLSLFAWYRILLAIAILIANYAL